MAHQDLSLPIKVLKALFPDSLLQSTAFRTKVLERNRKIEIGPLFWTLILGFGVGALRKIAQLRRSYENNSGTTLAASSFYDRFTPQLAKFLKILLSEALAKTNSFQGQLHKKMSSFKDLIVADATIIRLHNFLASKYPGTRTNHSKASAKLHVVMSLGAGIPLDVKLTKGRASDRSLLKVGKWAKGRLFIIDLGYFKYQLFSRIDRNGGFFISRLNKNANPVVVAQNKACRGRSVDVVGKKLKEVLPILKRETIDFKVEVSFRNRKYMDKKSANNLRFRVVGVLWEGNYRLYITNVPTSVLSSKEVAQTYRARWEIELIFKELKTHYRIHQLDTSNKNIVEALIYTAMLTMVASRALHRELLRREGLSPRSIPGLRWTAVFAALSTTFLYEIMMDYFGDRDPEAFWKVILYEALDPNRGRELICGLWGGEAL